MKTLLKDKRGDLTGVLYLVVMIAAFAFFILIVGYVATTLSTEMKITIGSDDIRVNESFEATENTANNTLSATWFIMFGGLLLGLVITAWYMPTKPIFVPIFIILLVVAIIVGVALSNGYESLYGVETLEATADTQTSVNFFMSNLPYVALIVGLIGLIVTFAKPKGEGAPFM